MDEAVANCDMKTQPTAERSPGDD